MVMLQVALNLEILAKVFFGFTVLYLALVLTQMRAMMMERRAEALERRRERRLELEAEL